MTNQPNKPAVKDSWKLIGHSHQIADTGDYDGHYEITNGKISLLTQDDDDESLQPIVDALNNSGCKFYQDDWFEFENKMLKDENAELREKLKETENSLDGATYNLKRVVKKCNGLTERVRELEVENKRILNEVKEINQLTNQSKVNATMRIIELETKNDRLCEALKKIADRFDPETQDFEGIIRIAEGAIKQNEK